MRLQFPAARRVRHRALLALLVVVGACASDGEGGDGSYASSAKITYEKGLAQLEDGNPMEALRTFELVRQKFPYSSFAPLAELKAADTHFEREKYTEAIDAYQNFLKFHPAHPQADWAAFRIGASHRAAMPSGFFLLPPPSEKDPTEARAARSSLMLYLSRYPKSEHVPEAQRMLAEVTGVLAEHELSVAAFYEKRERWEAAVGRYQYLLRSYPDAGYDDEVAFGLFEAFRKLGDGKQARAALERFLDRHPEDPRAAEARARLQEPG